MKSFIFSAVSAAALLVAGVSAQLTVNTPSNVLECAPLQITFSGGSPPYIILIFPGATPNSGTPLATFSNITGSPFVWTAVNQASGTSLDITLRDNSGLSAQTAPFTVIAGATTSCLNGTASGSNAGTNTPAAATTPTNTGATTTGTTPANTQSKSGTGSSASSTPTSSSNAAIIAGIPYGVAGVLGAAVAAVFV